jgi:hypothetical protein
VNRGLRHVDSAGSHDGALVRSTDVSRGKVAVGVVVVDGGETWSTEGRGVSLSLERSWVVG